MSGDKTFIDTNVLIYAFSNDEPGKRETELIFKAYEIHERYNYLFYDSLIISAAMRSGCKKLLSEDMHDGHIIEGKLTIINPFA